MAPRLLTAILAAGALCAAAGTAHAAALSVEGERFILTLDDGKRLTSPDLVGAELETAEGETIRIEAVEPAPERPQILLHRLSIQGADGRWNDYCKADAKGRKAAFPVAGAWDDHGAYIKDGKRWFLTCTSGSQAKCILWGYDPWTRGPAGEDLSAHYAACQHTVRADYDGLGESFTKDGTIIDTADDLGIQHHDTLADGRFAFEAGWGEKGAVCVARTRWPDLLTRETLLASAPALGGDCDEAEARRRGALIFTRVEKR